MSDKIQELPNPITETISWCRLNRPECVEYLERIHQTEGSCSSKDAQALLFLISLGFVAGRAYQAAPAHDQVPRFDKSPYP